MYLNSFGHEVAHNFGADHNREAFQNTDFKAPYEDAYGYWIKVRPQIHKYINTASGYIRPVSLQPTGASESSGYRTIMAYNGFGHHTR